MLVKASMVPLPVTAGSKFREAIYFFNRMLETRANVYLFPFHFSAFLSALRSVTFYLQAQFSGDSVFQLWYQEKQDEMRSDPLLRMLKEMRDEALHARPVELQFWHGPPIPGGGIETKHFQFSVETDPLGEIKMRMKLSEDHFEIRGQRFYSLDDRLKFLHWRFTGLPISSRTGQPKWDARLHPTGYPFVAQVG